MIDIETSTLSDWELRDYIIDLYTKRDEEIFAERGVNVLEFMLKKTNQYKLFSDNYQRINNSIINSLVKEKDFRGFYTLFTLGLVILGY